MTDKKKTAILGGGVSAMTAACYLTEKQDWLEEHGLHVWFGACVNSFKTLEKVYADLGRPSSAPLATFNQAFKPHSFIALE
jgi:uncharacterized protein with NAD-binding domain and iron-sulfur cluster